MGGLFQRNRTVYLETAGDRADKKKDDNDLTKSMPLPDMTEEREETDLSTLPEYQTLEEFIESCMDDDRATYNHLELRALCYNVKKSPQKVRAELTSYGLTLLQREKERVTRGFSSNPYTLYSGNPMAGGSGLETQGPGKVRR